MAHSPETKAAVMAALLAGQGVDEVARQYRLPKATVSRWKMDLSPETLGQIETKKRDTIADLLEGYLRENLATLTIQVQHFRDKTWLAKQPADALAVLHGVVADKAIRILSAAEVVQPDGDGGSVDPAAGTAKPGVSQSGG